VSFDSWPDLKDKIELLDRALLRERIKAFGRQHWATIISRWKKVSDKIEFVAELPGACD
jgi:hypothetical protein